MPSEEGILSQQKLLVAHRRTLSILLEQQALIGTEYVPPSIVNGTLEAQENIHRIKEILRGWGIQVDDEPNDEGFVGGRVLSKLPSFTSQQRALIGNWKFTRFIGKRLILSNANITFSILEFFEDGSMTTDVLVKGRGIFFFMSGGGQFSGKYTFPSSDTVRMEIDDTITKRKITLVCEYIISSGVLQLKATDATVMIYEGMSKAK